MASLKPHRERDAGTAALEAGIRLNQPRPSPPEPAHASAASLPFVTASLRPVVSKFGGTILESHAVHIPVQASATSVGAADNDNDFESRSPPELTNVYAGIPGYTGYKAQGAHVRAARHAAHAARSRHEGLPLRRARWFSPLPRSTRSWARTPRRRPTTATNPPSTRRSSHTSCRCAAHRDWLEAGGSGEGGE
jgi:hypothetical protein